MPTSDGDGGDPEATIWRYRITQMEERLDNLTDRLEQVELKLRSVLQMRGDKRE